MKCQYCGNENRDGAAFCGECGKPLAAETNFVIVEDKAETPKEQEKEVLTPEHQEEPVFQEIKTENPEMGAATACTDDIKPDHTVKGRTFGIIGFILSIEAILGCLVPFANFGALIYSIIGIIFAGISKKNVEFKLNRVGKTLSIIALIFSIITIVLYAILAIILFSYMVQGNGIDFGDFFLEIGKEGFVINIG